MDKELTTVKIWKNTRRLAKMLAAHCGVTMVILIHRLILEEIKRQGLSLE